MATATTLNTPLDDLKDLAWLSKERIGYALDQLGGNGIDTEDQDWAFDDVIRTAYETLAKHVPGVSFHEAGYPLFATEEAYKAAHTYEDGTPIVESISFPDVNGLTFRYRPRHDKARNEFLTWARAEADSYAAGVHARYTSAGDLGIEYVGGENGDFRVHLGEEEHTSLHRIQLLELREGIDRLLGTQAQHLNEMNSDEDDECSPQE